MLHRILLLMSMWLLGVYSVQSFATDLPSVPLNRESSLSTVRMLLKDSAFPEEVKGTFLVAKNDKSKPWRSYVISKDSQGADLIGRVSFYDRTRGQTDFHINLTDLQASSISSEPKWGSVQEGWDGFIKRHWPNARRVDDWQEELHKYNSSGNFNIDYITEYHGIRSSRIKLDVRLGDGKVVGVTFFDYSSYLYGSTFPPSPSSQQIIQSFQKALRTYSDPKTSSENTRLIRRYTIESVKRQMRIVDIDQSQNKPGKIPTFSNILVLIAKDETGEKALVGGKFFEHSKEAIVEWAYPLRYVEKLQSQYKPLTQSNDTCPRWSYDGKHLYFVTSRDASNRSWWNRAAILNVPSLARYDSTTSNVHLLRPFKFRHDDYDGYALPLPSPSGDILLFKGPAMHEDFVSLDMNQGIAYIPQGERMWDLAVSRRTATGVSVFVGRVDDAPTEMKENLNRLWGTLKSQGHEWKNWNLTGGDWLSDGSGFVATVEGNWPNFLLLKRDANHLVSNWKVHYIDNRAGKNILPVISDASHTLSWMSGDKLDLAISKGEGTNARNDFGMHWKFITATFDQKSAKTTNRIELSLDFHPLSLSWDSVRNRWLTVAENGELFWIQRVEKELKLEKAGQLTWEGEPLQALSASVSPTDGTIAVSAQLMKPKDYPVTEVKLLSTIFRWDGMNKEVKPLYDPSLNRIMPFVFPASKLPWAKVVGPVENYALAQQVEVSP